jgi:hypothetical protein
MNWMLRLYPAPWRERYGEEFGAVLAGQRPSPGLVLDVLAGAIDAHLHPQIQHSNSTQTQGDDKMTIAMLQRCALGGPKLSSSERRIASRYARGSALAMALLYLVLTKLYRGAPAVQAVIYAAIFSSSIVYRQAAYLRNRSRLTQLSLIGGGLLAMYLFMPAVCVVATKL